MTSGATPRVDAVLFDLFGTLAGFNFPEYDACAYAIANWLDAPAAAFASELEVRYHDLETGVLGLPAYLSEAAQRAGARHADPYRLGLALDRWRAFQDTQLRPWPDAVHGLGHVRDAGLPVALVSNAPPLVHELWPGSPLGSHFKVAIYSNVVGARKPDLAMYRHAAAGLGIAPDRCLFIGDGSSGELAGAVAAGMHAVQIRRPADPPENDARFGREIWHGPRIGSLHLLPRLLGGR